MRIRDKNGWSPLLLAARSGVLADLLPLFMEGEPALDEPHPENGLTALMCVATKGDVSGVKALIEAKAELDPTNSSDPEGWSALMYACSEGCE